MGMSCHVVGFHPPDEKWRKMKEAYDACKKAGVDPPRTVEEFFGYEPPDESGVEVKLKGTPCCKEYRAEMRDGYEIDLTKIPKGLTVIRFFNSY
jgi:hypothetical protein